MEVVSTIAHNADPRTFGKTNDANGEAWRSLQGTAGAGMGNGRVC